MGTQAFEGLRVVPRGFGICHQVNLEFLAHGVLSQDDVLYPDTLVGTDSHTPMINGLGVVGFGVGGIEAEAAMLGQPVYLLMPDVVGVHLHGRLREGVTATDLVLRVTERLRQARVIAKFVEYHGEGAANLSVPDRATLGNMALEYGATIGYFPVDEQTCRYLLTTGRTEAHVETCAGTSTRRGFSACRRPVSATTPPCWTSIWPTLNHRAPTATASTMRRGVRRFDSRTGRHRAMLLRDRRRSAQTVKSRRNGATALIVT